jgi:hypothetical protein
VTMRPRSSGAGRDGSLSATHTERFSSKSGRAAPLVTHPPEPLP